MGSDPQGPLGSMWRSVYRKAGQVAEGRTEQLLKEHAYLLHRTAGHTHGEDTGPWVDEAGDTMTGALTTPAVIIADPSLTADARVWGAGSSLTGVGTNTLAFQEVGVRFRSPDTTVLTGVRWYRVNATMPVPTGVRVWDSTSTGAPLYSLSAAEQEPFAETSTGWKTVRLTHPQALVAGRDYALSYGADGAPFEIGLGGTRVPDTPLEGVGSYLGSVGTYPVNPSANTYPLDAEVEYPDAPPAHAGAIRLPNGTAGAIAWRNAADTADHTLTLSSADALVFDGVPLVSGSANTTMHTQTGTPTGAPNSLWFNPSEAA